MTTQQRRPAGRRRSGGALKQRLERTVTTSQRARERGDWDAQAEAVVDCGWGRLIFAQTFPDATSLIEALRAERQGQRDIAFYVTEPHVVLANAPQEFFLDPSHTYRLWMSQYRPSRRRPRGFSVRRIKTRDDADAINALYAARHMVTVPEDFFSTTGKEHHLVYLVAVDDGTGKVIGTVTGIDHMSAFDDPEKGSSLWCLAVDPQAAHPGIGEALVRQLAELFSARGAAFMDLSVMHDNEQAIHLYEKLGFQRLPVFALKTKNSINEKLFVGPPVEETLNPYAMLIVNEARRRGIQIDVLDAEGGFFKLSQGGRSITCRESLSQLTDAIALSRCDDKAVTSRLLASVGLMVPRQQKAGAPEENRLFLEEVGALVVKPARGEQGRGISVDVQESEHLEQAVTRARAHCDVVLLERFTPGQDLRVIVINYKVVAAAVRRPPVVSGTGQHSIRALIEAQSRRRAAATGGESRIPLDAETERCVAAAGWTLDDILPANTELTVRKAANLHTGGTIHDVTDRLHPVIVDAAVTAARAIEIPVVGLDFLVPRIDGPDYVIIEANERPGLANHEPQPTAERFVDLLFPQTAY